MRISDWSSDVCSSDLAGLDHGAFRPLYVSGGRSDIKKDNPPIISRAARRLHCSTSCRPNDAALCLPMKPIDSRLRSCRRVVRRRIRLFDQLRWIRSEEHTSELQSLMRISYAVFCLKKKNSHI